MKNQILLFFLVCVSYCASAQKYIPADEGSRVHFVIKNFGINTGGDFKGLNGEINFDPQKLQQCFFNVTVKSNTVDTDNRSRDKNLKEAEYFDSGKFPEIRLVSTKIDKTNKTDDGYFYFTGNLIIKGISKPVSFPFKAEKRGDNYFFSGDFQINRLDFNVGSGSSILSSKVNITLSVLAKKN